MSIADELTKLNDLKEKGAISQAEFDNQKAALLGARTTTKRASGLGWKVTVGVIGAIGLIGTLVSNFDKGTGLPACTSDEAKSTLAKAFNSSQFARTLKLSAVEVTDAVEKRFDAKANVRTCAGKVDMNNLSTAHVEYTIQGRPDGQYLLTFEVVNESETARVSAVSLASAPATPPVQLTASVNKPAAVTRYGPITITDDQNVLFQGKPLSPPLDGGNSLSVSQQFEIGTDDVLLIQETGGTACPALFYFVRVSASGAKSTRSFGTCSDVAKVARESDMVSVSMPGFKGSFEPKADQEAAAKEVHVFVYRGEAVAEERRAHTGAPTQIGPSFSCGGKLSPSEKLICDTPSLSQADSVLAKSYAAAMARASDPSALKQQQRHWRGVRDACGDAACMEAAYSKRMAELSRP